MVSPADFQRRFFRRLARPWDIVPLFDYLPDAYFYAKNQRGQFVMVNRALAALHGVPGPEAMIGRTDADFSPRDLAEQFVEEDRRVMQSREPLAYQAWLIPNCHGVLKWYLSSKIPLFDAGGKVIGIAGAMRDVEKASEWLAPYQKMEAAVTFLLAHHAEKIDFHRLAKLAHLSLSQFDRRFKRLFQLTPQQFLTRARINAASQMLVSTDKGVGQIAQQTGFYDQSHFTKRFFHQKGLTPLAYRREHRRKPLPLASAERADCP